ncbi:MAG: sodium:solute symporter, partial [Oscillospiraceae bacterium]
MDFLMKKETQIFTLLAIYVFIMFFIGIKSYKKANSLTNFVVGGRKAGPWMSAFAYGTSYFSSVIFIGYAGKSGWAFGWWAVLIGVGNAIIGSLFAWLVLAEKTRDVTRRLKIKTMPQFFEQRYGSKNMKYFASAVIFIFMIPYSASVYSGLSYLCETTLNINYYIAMGIIALIAAVYLILGGYLASLKADFVQGIIMIGGIILMVIFVINSDFVGGFINGIENLSGKMNESGILYMNSNSIIELVSLILLTSLGTWGLPQMTQKFYGIANKKAVKTATIVSTFFAFIISCGAYFIGSLARLFPFAGEAAKTGGFDTI